MATIITNVTQLQAMENNLDGDYELGNDINASATSAWNGGAGFAPVGSTAAPFTGTLDGKKYTVSDLFIDRSAREIGLFGVINNATITDVRMTGCNITGEQRTGALAGEVKGTTSISDCTSAGAIVSTDGGAVGGLIGYVKAGTVTDCSSSAAVEYAATGFDLAGGGFCGGNEGTITSCYATGSLSATNQTTHTSRSGGFTGGNGGTISKSYATGNVTGPDAGGFAGANSGTMSDCYARGDVDARNTATGYGDAAGFVVWNTTGNTVEDCFSTGLVQGDETLKGFCATNDGTINTSFWDTQTSGQASSDGGTGKTTAQMKTESTFTDAGWNFTTIWFMISDVNNGYPAFRGAIYDYVMTAGNFAVVEDRVHYMSKAGIERYNSGIIIGDTTIARGNIAAVEERFQYVGATSQKERYILGIEIGNTTMPNGNIGVVEERFHYAAAGKERYWLGTPV